MLADELQTIAEIAVAIAGFAGLVFILRDLSDDSTRSRVLNLLRQSFITIIIALVPAGFVPLGIPDELHAQLASGVFVLLVSINLAFYLPEYFRLKIHQTSVGRSLSIWAMPLMLGNLALQLVNAVGLISEYSVAVFYYGMLILLFLCGVQFVGAFLGDNGDA